MLSAPSLSLVEGSLDPGRDLSGGAGHLTLTLPAAITAALLTRVAAAFHGGINDVLLTGLVVAVADWCRRRGRGGGTAVLLDLEGHGREEVFGDVELSRTVGWFTSLFPVRLDPGAIDLDEAMAGGAALGRALKPIKEQLRALPDHGLGYGLLRYLNPQTGGAACCACRAAAWLQLSRAVWRCRGRGVGSRRRGGAAWRRGRCRAGAGALPGGQCAHARWQGRAAADGELVVCAGAGVAEPRSAIWRGAGLSALEALVRHAQAPGAGGRSPSDLPLLGLSQAEIEQLERKHPQIEDILPLAPLQEGLLFHALYDAQAPDVYTVQLVLELAGRLDEDALRGCGAGSDGAPFQPAGGVRA